jgi:hypothetical protein
MKRNERTLSGSATIQTLKLASWLLATALFAMPFTSFAQTADEDNSDNAMGTELATDTVEKVVGLPTSPESAVTMGLEKATGLPLSDDSVIEAVARAAGMSADGAAVLSGAANGIGLFFDSSSTATDLQEGNPWQVEQQVLQAQQAAAADRFYQQKIQPMMEPTHLYLLHHPKPNPTVPQIESCGVGACK